MLSAWSVLCLALVASAAPNNYGNYGQKLQKTNLAVVAEPTELLPGFDCSDKEDGAHGEGCDSSYWLCWKGVATSADCPNDMMFNIENGQCDIADNVFACSGVRTTTAVFFSDNAQMPEVDFDCSHLEDGDYSFSDKTCQDKYVSCVAGAAWERTCPEGLSFDLENRVCMLMENIIACGGSAPTEAPVLVISFDCPTPTGKFALLSHLCSPTYYICEDNVASIGYCDEPMIWDDDNKECRQPMDIPECSFSCSGKADSSYSEGCSQNYWWCWEEKATKLACPDNMWFDGDRALCDFKENVVECGGSLPTTPAPIVSDNATPMPVDFDCSNVEDGQHAFKNGEICQPRFVSCVGGVAWEMSCPDGLMFDPDQMQCERLDAIIACGGTPEPITTTYSYETTLAAEPTTLKSYGSYQAPARKTVKHVSRIEKASYGSYQAPALKVVKPVSHIQKTSSYGSYQAPVVHKNVVKPRKAMKLAEETTTLPADNYYQTEATLLAAEPIISRRRSFDAYQPEATTILAEVTTRLRPHKTKALLTTTPFADDTPFDFGFEKAYAPEIRSVVSDDETPAAYGSYQAPIADATTRRHIMTTRQAALTTPASYGYEAPAADVTTRRALIEKASYGSYQAPALKVVKPAIRLEKPSYGSYAEETTVMADLPTTKSYGYEAPAVKLVTPASRIEKASYGSYQAPALKVVKRVEKPSYGSYAEETTIMADLPTTKSYGYQAPAIKLVTPASRIEKASYGSYQAPALKAVKRVSLVEKDSYGAEETTIMADLPTTKSYGYQAPAVKLVTPASRIEKASYGSYQAPALKVVKRVEKPSYQAPAVKLVKEKASY